MDTDQFAERRDAYARAIGLAILAMNHVEAEVFFILDVMNEARPGDEAAYLPAKLQRLEEVASRQQDSRIRKRLQAIASRARAFITDRNNFAHASLWIDATTNAFRRRYVRQKDGVSIEDQRSPEDIEAVADDIEELSWEARDAAMSLGGVKRWEEHMGWLDRDAQTEMESE